LSFSASRNALISEHRDMATAIAFALIAPTKPALL
jgi:hypothetical protein